MLKIADITQCINLAAKATARSIHDATLNYWHVHTTHTDRDQPNERNLTCHFLMNLFSLLKQVDRAPSMYFEATINGDRLDGLIVLEEPKFCLLVESKHLNSQNSSWNISSDTGKMLRFQKELQNRLSDHEFIHLVLSDNWYEKSDGKWDQEPAIRDWSKSTMEIRKTPDGQLNWRLFLAWNHVPRIA